jgi:hypothetical protein
MMKPPAMGKLSTFSSLPKTQKFGEIAEEEREWSFEALTAASVVVLGLLSVLAVWFLMIRMNKRKYSLLVCRIMFHVEMDLPLLDTPIFNMQLKTS